MISIFGNTADEKFTSVQQILNQIQIRNLAGSGGTSFYTLKEYWLALPADAIIFRHFSTQTGYLKFAFSLGTIDLPNTTVEVTVTDVNGIATVTIYASTTITAGFTQAINVADRIQIKIIVGGAAPTDIWVTADGV